jgi:hypothetical protein
MVFISIALKNIRVLKISRRLLGFILVYSYCIQISGQTNVYDIRKIVPVDRQNNSRFDIVCIGHDVADPDPDNTQILFLQNQANGNFASPRKFEQQVEKPLNLFKGRVDGDRLEDVVVIIQGDDSNNGGLYVSRNRGGRFSRFERFPDHLQNPKIWAGVMLDLDGDGREDMITIINPDRHFKDPSGLFWAKNIGDGMNEAFSPWQKLEINEGEMNQKMAFYELAFSNYGGELLPDALSLMLSAEPGNRWSAEDYRGLAVSFQEGAMRFLPMKFVVDLSRGITQAFGFAEDIDIGELFPGRKGVFLLFRQDLIPDGRSSGDRIDFILKRDARTRGYRGDERFLNEKPVVIFKITQPVYGTR